MKAIIAAMLILLTASVSYAAPERVNGWRQARWGMTEAEVLKAFKGEAIRDENPKESPADGRGSVCIPQFSLASQTYRVTFWFTQNRLGKISISRDGSNLDGRAAFRSIEAMLREKYGPPSLDRSNDKSRLVSWKMDWNLKGTNISLVFIGSGTTDSGSVWLDYLKPTADLNRL